MDEKVKKILEKHRQISDKRVQRAELLARNKTFLEELKGIAKRLGGGTFFELKKFHYDLRYREKLEEESEENLWLRLDYPKTRKCRGRKPKDRYFKDAEDLDCQQYYNPRNLHERIWNKGIVFQQYTFKWEDFCRRWDIGHRWDGKIDSLSIYLSDPAEIRYTWNDETGRIWLEIRINEWTTLEDIRAKWKRIEELQNEFWGKREGRTNFNRDLCWYDLAKECKLRPSEIAKIWAELHPEDIDLLVIRGIKKEISKEDRKGKELDDFALIREVKSGFLSPKYAQDFEDERSFYITGQSRNERGKVMKSPVPFVDVIKKAIKRMEKDIKNMVMVPKVKGSRRYPFMAFDKVEKEEI